MNRPGLPPLSAALRQALRGLVADRTGIVLNATQIHSLDNLMAEMCVQTQPPLAADQLYQAFVAGEYPELFADFIARLTIGETHFFRVAPQIHTLSTVVLPDLLAQRAATRKLNIWSAGCSTGEEAYTLAILLHEALPTIKDWRVRLVGTDLSGPALARAERAVYRAWSFRETPTRVRRQYFTDQGGTWQLDNSIRQMVDFGYMNLVEPGLPALFHKLLPLDLIVCRNVTIYFSPEVCQQLYRRFADLLAPDGWLLLGPSDPIPAEQTFTPLYLEGAICWRKPAAASLKRTATVPAPPKMTSVAIEPASVSRVPRRQSPAKPVKASPDLDTVRNLVAAGQVATAQRALKAMLATAPLSAEAHLLLGLIALDSGDIPAAVESLRRATFLKEDDPLAQFGLGRAYRATNDLPRARAAFRQARRVLAALPDNDPIIGDEALSVARLREAVDTQLTILGVIGG